MRPASRGPAILGVIALVVMLAIAAVELWRGLQGPFGGAAVITGLLLAAARVLAAWHLTTGRNGSAVRRGAWLSALVTLVPVLNCSATGITNLQSTGYQLAMAAPLVYPGVSPLLGGAVAGLADPACAARRPAASGSGGGDRLGRPGAGNLRGRPRHQLLRARLRDGRAGVPHRRNRRVGGALRAVPGPPCAALHDREASPGTIDGSRAGTTEEGSGGRRTGLECRSGEPATPCQRCHLPNEGS
jgi:hypothetical protein